MRLFTTRSQCAAVFISVILFASCSSSNTQEATETLASASLAPTTVVSSTTVFSSTTVAATTTTSVPVAPAGNCLGTEDALAEAVGEPLGVFVCDKEWASFMTKDYAQTCENCESLSIAQWADGAWEEVGDFNQNFMLSPSDVSKQMTAESLCAIWSTNRSSEFIAETGCSPSS